MDAAWQFATALFLAFEMNLKMISIIDDSVGEVWSRTNWDLVWTGPNPAVPVPVPVQDFPKNTGPLGLQSGQFHIAQDGPDPVWTT